MKSIAISTGPDTHLDHLAVICDLLEIPLIVTDESHLSIANQFYPQIKVKHKDFGELTLEYLSKWDAIFGCGKFWAMELIPALEMTYHKKMRFVFCPHGNSDKGGSLPSLEIPQDISLLYGQQMADLLKKTNFYNQIKQVIFTGNLRYPFYLKYKNHFDSLAKEKIFSKLDPSKPILLYCPTWHTEESPTSFFESISLFLTDTLQDYNLILKIHPLLEEQYPAHTFHALQKLKQHKFIHLLSEFPAIYPLLEKTDLYIGDFSSIGYDFLLYDRPMLFLNLKSTTTFLHECGWVMKNEKIDKLIKKALQTKQKEYSSMRKKTYDYAFGETPNKEALRKNIFLALEPVLKPCLQSLKDFCDPSLQPP
ncbi:MAG: CDP-glycerol glycerophosphotransferase family protein [Chlamydiae bacterium]|nr:CDP-glycerol glycerophosphotransferase family protein [Chlamydiota bacterium]